MRNRNCGLTILVVLLLVVVGIRIVNAQWIECGAPICTYINDQGSPRIVPDGDGGAIIAWLDDRQPSCRNIYAQRVNGEGYASWTMDGHVVYDICNPCCGYNKIIPDGSGGAIIAWQCGICNDDDIYAQKIDSNGNTQWSPAGAAVCTLSGYQFKPQMVSDGAGGVIITWRDNRNYYYDNYDTDIYAQRIDATGDAVWIDGGLAVCSTIGSQAEPQIIPDGEGGAIVAWRDYRDSEWINYAQRIDGSGDALWANNGIPVCSLCVYQQPPAMTSDGSGGAIIAWADRRDGVSDENIFAQRIDPNGNLLWGSDGVPVCRAPGIQYDLQIVSDNTGGAIIVWSDLRDDPSIGEDIYAQRVDADGDALWTIDGVVMCPGTSHEIHQAATSDGDGGVIVAWQDYRSGEGTPDIYAQRIDAGGNRCWSIYGAPICTATGGQGAIDMIPDGKGGAYITWQDGRDSGNNIYVQAVDRNGNAPPVPFAIQCPPDTTIPAFTNDPYVPLSGFRITNTSTTDLAFSYNLVAEGPARLVDNGNPASISGTTPYLAPAESYSPPEPVLELVPLREYAEEIIIHRVSVSGLPELADSCMSVVSFEPPVPSLLRSYSACRTGPGITLKWTLLELPESVRFFVLRAANSDGAFRELHSPEIIREDLSFTFRDDECEAGSTYRYRLEVLDAGGRRVLFETDPIVVPAMLLTLFQNYPNPFNPITTICYYLPERCRVRLCIYDGSGRRLAVLVDGEQEAGFREAYWNGTDEKGIAAATGVYFYRITAGKETISRKLLVLR